jgi:hypothetical protein
MKPEFIPKTLSGKLHWISEEIAEVSQAIAKTQRFREETGAGLLVALHMYDPTIPHAARETNHAWILRELYDLKAAIALFEAATVVCCSGKLSCGLSPSQTFTCAACAQLLCRCSSSSRLIPNAGPDKICVGCWTKPVPEIAPTEIVPPKKPHAKKQSQQTKPKPSKKVRAKKGAVSTRERIREHRADHDRRDRR